MGSSAQAKGKGGGEEGRRRVGSQSLPSAIRDRTLVVPAGVALAVGVTTEARRVVAETRFEALESE